MSQEPEPSDARLTDDHPWLEDGFLTTPEAADLLGPGVIPLDIRIWCRKGLIRYVKEPCSRKYLVCEADVRAIAKACDGPVNAAAISKLLLRKRFGRGATSR